MPRKQLFSPERYAHPMIRPSRRYHVVPDGKCAYTRIAFVELHDFLLRQPDWAETACPQLRSHRTARSYPAPTAAGASAIKDGAFTAQSRCGRHTLVYRLENFARPGQPNLVKITPAGTVPKLRQLTGAFVLLAPFTWLSLLAGLFWAWKYRQSFIDSVTYLTCFCAFICYNEHIDLQ